MNRALLLAALALGGCLPTDDTATVSPSDHAPAASNLDAAKTQDHTPKFKPLPFDYTASLPGGADLQSPFPVELSLTLPSAPAVLPSYEVLPVDTGLALARLHDTLGVPAEPRFEEDAGGSFHASSGDVHAYVYELGGYLWQDYENGMHERRIQPAPVAHLWDVGQDLLADLGLTNDPFISYDPAEAGQIIAEAHDAQGAITDHWVTAQRLSWVASVDGLPTFGGGSEISMYFGDDATVGTLIAPAREIARGEPRPLIGPREALANYFDNAAQTGRISVLRSATPNIISVDLTDMTLGYWMSDMLQREPVVAPTWEIRGTITFEPTKGDIQTADLLWYQPAFSGVTLTEIGIHG